MTAAKRAAGRVRHEWRRATARAPRSSAARAARSAMLDHGGAVSVSEHGPLRGRPAVSDGRPASDQRLDRRESGSGASPLRPAGAIVATSAPHGAAALGQDRHAQRLTVQLGRLDWRGGSASAVGAARVGYGACREGGSGSPGSGRRRRELLGTRLHLLERQPVVGSARLAARPAAQLVDRLLQIRIVAGEASAARYCASA